MGPFDNQHMTQHSADLFRIDDCDGGGAAVFFVLVTRAVSSPDLSYLYHRTLQCGFEKPFSLGAKCSDEVVTRYAVLHSSKSGELQLYCRRSTWSFT